LYQPGRRDEKAMLLGRSNQDPRPLMQFIVEDIIDRFIKHRGFAPKLIIVFRNGCSEGQFTNVSGRFLLI